MKYIVRVAVEGRVEVTVDADSIEEAKEIANDQVCDMDFGPLEDIEWDTATAWRVK